jgi:hypothetical protein
MKTAKLRKKLNKKHKPRSKVKAPPTKIHKNKKKLNIKEDLTFEVDVTDLCA